MRAIYMYPDRFKCIGSGGYIGCAGIDFSVSGRAREFKEARGRELRLHSTDNFLNPKPARDLIL